MRVLLCLTIVFFVLSDASNSGSFKRIPLMKATKPGKDSSPGKGSGTGNAANGGGCPPGVPMVRCFADPCTVTPCPAYPNANCTANYCGGCHAIFTQNGHTVDCGTGTSCPPGQPLVQCVADPCTTTTCSSCPNAHCTPNYCGTCTAIFKDDNGVVNCSDNSYHCVVTTVGEGEHCGGNIMNPPQCAPGLVCTPVPGSPPFGDVGGVCKAPGTGTSCPPGQPLVQCIADPCSTATCSSCPNAHCTPSYCGTCTAIFKDDNGVVNCSDNSYHCVVTTVGAGQHCGGNMMNPPQCAPGLVCTPVPGSGPFGDVGGVCKEPVVCTMEAKICPDGSSVGRDPNNNCEFTPCPTPSQQGGGGQIFCTEDVMRCPDGSWVGRDPNRGCAFEPCSVSSSSNGKQSGKKEGPSAKPGKGKGIGSAP